MKKQLYILFVLLFSAVYVLGQSVVSYEYWFDNDFAQRVNQPISPNDPLTVSTQVGTQNLTPGFHSLNFRAMDDSGFYSPISTTYFYKITPPNSTPSSTLTAIEYWWNNDYAQRQTLAANHHSVILLDTLLSASVLHRGFNALNVRFKDGDGLWSSISTHYFLIPNFDSGSNPQSVTQLEYWWNNDYANRTSIPNTPTSVIQLDSVLAAAQLSRGFNSLNVRYRDTNGLWSSVSTSCFLRIEPTTPSLPQDVVEYEYWFNTDFQQRVSQTSTGSFVQLNMPISTANLSPGFNTINFRYKQSSGIWSSVVSSYFVLPPSPSTWSGNTISKYRYWFDQNVQQAHTVLLPNPVSNTAIQSAISMVNIPKGVRVLHVQFVDAAGHWSSVSVDSIIKNPLPIGGFNYSASSNCDSLQVSFTSTSIDADTYLWSFGDGSTSTALHPTHAYSAPGSYVVQLTVSDTTALLDSTVQKTVQVFGNTFSTFSVSQCESYIAPSGTVFTTSGVYQDTIANFNGCDSIITINVSILQPAQFTDVQSSCGPYTWVDGITYTSSNNSATYTYTGGAANGCDSIITLDLTVNNAVSSTQTISACGSFHWINGNTYTSNNNSATYTYVGGAANGCDSTVTLDLTILNPASSTQTVSACDSYMWIDGNTYTSNNNSATYTYVGGAANGCDSIVSLDLTINTVETGVTQNNTTLTANASAAQYQWLDCSNNFAVIPSENGQSFTAVNNGFYAVEVTENGCTDTSACYEITGIGLHENDGLEFLVYPNPTDQNITIRNLSHSPIEKIEIRNQLGQLVPFEANYREEVDVRFNLAEGVYTVVIHTSRGTITRKIVVHR